MPPIFILQIWSVVVVFLIFKFHLVYLQIQEDEGRSCRVIREEAQVMRSKGKNAMARKLVQQT